MAKKVRNGVTRKWQGSKWISPARRLAIYLRDDFTCLVCERRLNDCAAADVTLDHIKPWADGGRDETRNLYTCCRSCNSRRKDKPLMEFVDRDRRARIRNASRRSLTRYLALARGILKTRRQERKSAT